MKKITLILFYDIGFVQDLLISWILNCCIHCTLEEAEPPWGNHSQLINNFGANHLAPNAPLIKQDTHIERKKWQLFGPTNNHDWSLEAGLGCKTHLLRKLHIYSLKLLLQIDILLPSSLFYDIRFIQDLLIDLIFLPRFHCTSKESEPPESNRSQIIYCLGANNS